MLLAIDVGNTEVTLGLFDGRRLTRSFRLSSETRRTADEISLALTQIFPELARRGEHAAVLASVVPTATASFLEAARKVCGVEPLEVSSRIPTGGPAPMIAKHSETIEKVDPDLTLHGLRIIQEMNGGAGPAKPKKRRE